MDPEYQRRVDRSKKLTPEERFYGTLEMVNLSRELMKAGIRLQFPEADDQRVRDILLERLRISQKLENRQ